MKIAQRFISEKNNVTNETSPERDEECMPLKKDDLIETRFWEKNY